MDGFFDSFRPLLSRLRRYGLEIAMIGLAAGLTLTSLIVYAKSNRIDTEQKTEISASHTTPKTDMISVDISGEVKRPGLYNIGFGARLKDVVDQAGGLSDEADTIFFKRNFNLARVMTDQEKVYIPSISEILNGVFTENQKSLDYSSPASNLATSGTEIPISNKISVNTGTVDELDQLPGVGQATANKIIIGRPYIKLEDLISKKALNKSLFENIKELISL